MINFRCGKALVSKWQTYKDAHQRIAQLVTRLEGIWIRSEEQIKALQDIWEFLPISYQRHQQRILQELYAQLQTATHDVTGLARTEQNAQHGFVVKLDTFNWRKRAKYTLHEASLLLVLDGLEAWQRRFDPSWFLIIRIANTGIDTALSKTAERTSREGASILPIVQRIRRELQKREVSGSSQSVVRQSSFLVPGMRPIPGSSSVLAKAQACPNDIIVDTTTYPKNSDFDIVAGHVDNLARLLSISDPSTLGLLACVGVIPLPSANDGEPNQFQMLFEIPTGLVNPSSLRSILAKPPGPLDDRFAIARCLARSIMSVHSAAFVHKNIRPETIILFQQTDSPAIIAFPVGFERFRLAAAGTALAGDARWERNIYRHPSRQGTALEQYYIMQHDIYSLGVCLLEIGLWISFVSLSEENPTPAPQLGITNLLEMKNKREVAIKIKARLVDLAQDELPTTMGRAYADVVGACLTCLDPGESSVLDRQPATGDDDGVVIGVDYMEQIYGRLESIFI